jgi:hypothetical protein
MIGSNEIPLSLEGDRLFRNGGTATWRESWDRFDDFIVAGLEALQKPYPHLKIPVYSFRSNMARVSISSEESGWVVAWDERFFDYVISQLRLLLHDRFDQIAANELSAWLLQYVGESYALTDPHYALKFLDVIGKIRPKKNLNSPTTQTLS